MNVRETRLKGLYYIELDVHADERGNFREVWQDEKMRAEGLPEFHPLQSNVAESSHGVLRGIHAEPWEKYIHVAYGSVFAAIVDLREDSPTFAQYETFDLNQGNALFVSKGFGNSYQVTSEHTAYTYLVPMHWKPGIIYPAIASNDADLAIPWPVTDAIVSEKDKGNKTLRQYYPHKFA